MFLKISELKKIMKDALKSSGLIVGNTGEWFLVYTEKWGVATELQYLSNKFKAAVIELIGDLPKEGEAYLYNIDEHGLKQAPDLDPVDPYDEWMAAKDVAVKTGVNVRLFAHEYAFYQVKQTHTCIAIERRYVEPMISPSDLDKTEGEWMPPNPSVRNGTVLHFKNDMMIYWVAAEPMPEKTRNEFLPLLESLDFFNEREGVIPY